MQGLLIAGSGSSRSVVLGSVWLSVFFGRRLGVVLCGFLTSVALAIDSLFVLVLGSFLLSKHGAQTKPAEFQRSYFCIETPRLRRQ